MFVMATAKRWFILFALIAIISCAVATPEKNEGDELSEGSVAATEEENTPAKVQLRELTEEEKQEKERWETEKDKSCSIARFKSDAEKNLNGVIFCRGDVLVG